MVSELQV